MARYDVFLLEGSYLLDVQTDLIEHLATRVVVPLLPVTIAPPAVRKLNPVFEVHGRKLVMATPLAGAISRSELGENVANLARHHEEITAALDMLFRGF